MAITFLENLKVDKSGKEKFSFPKCNNKVELSDMFVGVSDAVHKLRNKIRIFAKSNFRNLLITGETGTGKEVVSQCLHQIAHS